jgi:uncharacterized protein DUF2800
MGDPVSAHADASPSSSSIWINCPASVTLARGKQRRASIFTAEGSVAHLLAEAILNTTDAPGLVGQTVTHEGFDIRITEEMVEGVQVYVDEVQGLFATADETGVEARVSIDTDGDERIFGTCDAWAVNYGLRRLYVRDLKFGQGVEVSPDSSQLKIYALGVLGLLGPFVDLDTIDLGIVQPRAGGIKTHTMSLEELIEWERSTLTPAVARLNAGDPTEVAGDHCRWCVRAGECRAFAALANSVAKVAFGDTPPDPSGMENDELGEILNHAETISAWVTKLRAEVSGRLDAGQDVPGWKLVAKRAVTKWSDETGALSELMGRGIPFDEISRIETLGEVKTVMKRYRVKEDVLQPYTVKESSGSTLVSAKDPRPPIASGARNVFIENVEDNPFD